MDTEAKSGPDEAALCEVYNPLGQYRDEFAPRFIEVARQEFKQIADIVEVDPAANAETCRLLRSLEEKERKVSRTLNWLIALCVVMWLLAITGVALCIWGNFISEVRWLIYFGIVVILICLFAAVHPRITALKHNKATTNQDIQQTRNTAWQQMKPLNMMYDVDIISRMITKTLPLVHIDPYLSAGRLSALRSRFGYEESNSDFRSVLSLQSGDINGSPFVARRYLEMYMGSRTYTGSITVMVTHTERDSKGRYVRVQRPETLTASVSKPCPYYNDRTELIFANDSAPLLTFARQQSLVTPKVGSFTYNWNKRKLKRKARKMNQDFAMMSNEEFEVLFNTENRNNNQQYALLFTPVAQKNMIELLRDPEKIGFGDNFNFTKSGKLNYIESNHMQTHDLDWDPQQFYHYEYATAEELFVQKSLANFRDFYFAIAPLLCIPLYQQMRPMPPVASFGGSSPWEHEVLANHWGAMMFNHPACVTQSILKTQAYSATDGSTTVRVSSYGFRTEPRVDYIPRYSSDGARHIVPVHWDEYIPVEGRGQFAVVDDSPLQSQNVNHSDNHLRLRHLRSYLR